MKQTFVHSCPWSRKRYFAVYVFLSNWIPQKDSGPSPCPLKGCTCSVQPVWEEISQWTLSVDHPGLNSRSERQTFPTEAQRIHFPSQLNKNPSRLVFRAPCKTNLFSHVFAWWCGRISKWKTTNLVPVNKHQNDVPLSRHASKTQSWVYFKNKIITIQIKTRQVNTKITLSGQLLLTLREEEQAALLPMLTSRGAAVLSDRRRIYNSCHRGGTPARNQTVTPEPNTTYHSAGKWATQFTNLHSCILTLCRNTWAILHERDSAHQRFTNQTQKAPEATQSRVTPRWRCPRTETSMSSLSFSLFPEQHQQPWLQQGSDNYINSRRRQIRPAANHCARLCGHVHKYSNKAIHWELLTKEHGLKLTK